MSEAPSRLSEEAKDIQAANAGHLFSLSLLGLGGELNRDGRITKEIDNIRKEIEEKNEEIARLNKRVEKLQELNEDLRSTVELKNKETKALEAKIEKLEHEKKALEAKLRTVEVELEAVRKEVVDLEKISKNSEKRSNEMEQNVQKLTNKMDVVKKSLEESRNENRALKKEVKNLREEVQRRTPFGVSERRALPAHPAVERASLVLGELCWRIQAMMYQNVHPNLYDYRKSYKIKHIEEDIEELADETQQREAQRRWAELKKKLNWKKSRHTRAMKSIQDSRNTAAHPELNEELLVTSAEVMEKAEKLTDWHDPACVQELIDMWKKLKQPH